MEDNVDIVLEEGELTDDSEDNYVPLERPANYSASISAGRFPIQIDQESDLDSQSSSTSDTDSDSQVSKSKKPKMKLKLKPFRTEKKKNYNIWSSRVQEDVLSETLICCDVSRVDRSRDVETYDYTLSAKYIDSRNSNKRTHSDRKNPNLRLSRKPDVTQDDVNGTPRIILDLVVTLVNTDEEVAKDIANKLCEEKDELILSVVKVAGKEKAVQIYNETKRIEKGGGMLIMNQTRRRTPGGVYFFLVKHDYNLTQEQMAKIFDDERDKYKREMKLKQKLKKKQMKAKIRPSTNDSKNLPDLLTRAELCVQKLATDNDRSRKESDLADVINPPPTPETDGHDNSGDGIDINSTIVNRSDDDNLNAPSRNVQNYDDDYLDMSCGNDMDLF